MSANDNECGRGKHGVAAHDGDALDHAHQQRYRHKEAQTGLPLYLGKGMADKVRVTRDMRRHVQYQGASKVHTVTCVRVWQKGGVWALLWKGLPLLLRI